jgi:tetratricopeptide (TPR) repeat protein
MDLRAAYVLALGLATGLLGCAPHGLLPVVPADSKGTQTAAAADLPPDDGKPHKPHAATYVAAGDLAEKTSDDPQRGPAERERLQEQARKAYQQAIALEPDYVPAHQALARLYLKLGDAEHAVATYQKVLKAHPKEAPLWFELGMCYSRQKQWDRALESLRQAVKLDPENRPYVNTLGFCLARAGRYDESLACFRKLSGPARAHYNLARMLHHLNHDDLSRQHLRLALEADPDMTPARQLLAQLEAQPTGVIQASGTEEQDAEPQQEAPGR